MFGSLNEVIQAGLIQGAILALVALGVMIPFKILKMPDVSAEGAYPLGGAMAASLVLLGVPAILATSIAMLCGGLLGLLTALIHRRLKVDTLLAGIIMSTMFYSINLHILTKPNLGLFDIQTIFTSMEGAFSYEFSALIFLLGIVILFLYCYLISEKGLKLRAVGFNPIFAQKQGIALTPLILFGFFIGNTLNALAGALVVQMQQYADIGMGVGIVIHALAALMIGESFIGSQTLFKQILAPIVGALIYQQIQGFIMTLGFAPTDLKLITGIIVLTAIAYRKNFAGSLDG